jgi:hypothetical protein
MRNPVRQDNQAWIAFTGQVSTHAPQSMQVSASMTRLLPCSLMALTGQESSHAAQLVQSSVMVWDTVFPPSKIVFPAGKLVQSSIPIFQMSSKEYTPL